MAIKMRLVKRKIPQIIIEFMILYVCVMGVLLLLGAPHAIEYILDLCSLLLFLYIVSVHKINRLLHNKLVIFQLLMLTGGIIIALVNGVSPLLVAWALRNYLRFLVFFGACLLYVSTDDYERIFRKLDILFYINALMVALEYTLLHYTADEIGGIFGETQTTNGDLNIFLIVMTTYYVIKWERKEKNLASLIMAISIDLFICVMAELKMFFFEIVIIFLMVFIISRFVIPGKKFPFKWIAIIIAGVIGLRIAIDYLERIYTNWAGFFTYEKILEELTRTGGYSNRGDINRFTFMEIIDKQIFQGDFFSKIFGIGLGGAEYSGTSELLTSSFYKRFWSLHYHYFSASWIYIECGIVGLVLYIASFISTLTSGIGRIRHKNNIDNKWILFGIVLSMLSIVLVFYNQSMRLPSAYLIYLMLVAVFQKWPKSSNSFLRKHDIAKN